MPVLEKKKVTNNGIPDGLLENQAQEVKAVVKGNAQETTKPVEAGTDKATNITFRITEQEKAIYKAFFAGENVSLSFGIQIAIEHLMRDVKAGKGQLKKTGYFEF